MKALLDPGFQPMILWLRQYQFDVRKTDHRPIVLSVVRQDGYTESLCMDVFAPGIDDTRNNRTCERLVKCMLWIFGGYRIIVSGSGEIYEFLKKAYSPEGLRAFDAHFMEDHFEQPFSVEYRPRVEDAPATLRNSRAIGRHLDGCRIGFDAGGSDRKVSAVIDGETVYSEEVVWHPKLSADPSYQYAGILEAFQTAASKLPRVDAIGVSSAGTFRNNLIRNCSLFIKVPRDVFEARVKGIYLEIASRIGPDIPIEVANDGDVTALAGSMELEDNCVLGIAMGTSEAGGYIDADGNITGWLNELAFVPVDANPDAMVDEWSGDYGCGVKYFSQDGVIRLAPAAGIELDEALSPAEKLKVVQALMKKGDPRAVRIFETLGVCFGYAIAWYAFFYQIRHVLIMGRVTSGEGGPILLNKAREVLSNEFPGLLKELDLNIPDEAARRVGQSVAAASLAEIRKKANSQ